VSFYSSCVISVCKTLEPYLSKYWKFGARGVSVESARGDTHNITVMMTRRYCEQPEYMLNFHTVE